jgi:hypothetical protein
MDESAPPGVLADESSVEWKAGPLAIISVLSGHRTEDDMKLALCLALLSLIVFSPARAQEYERGTALLCDTQRQVERYVALFTGEEQSAINAVNTEEQNPNACGIATVAFMRGPELGTARNKESAFQIVHVLVVGIETASGLRSVRPSAYFSAFRVIEYDV